MLAREGATVTEIYRGQQGHPTPPDREAGPVEATDGQDPAETAPTWRQPEAAEEILKEVRQSLQQADPSAEPANAAE